MFMAPSAPPAPSPPGRNSRPQHVAMHLGGGDIVTFGSTPPRRTTVNYRTDYIGSRSYL